MLPEIVFEEPRMFFLLIPLVPVLLLLIRRRFVTIHEDDRARRRRGRLQSLVIFSRLAIAGLLVTAAAMPAMERELPAEDAPVVRLLVDNSSSMSLFQPVAGRLEQELSGSIGVERIPAGDGERSGLGDAILSKLGKRRQLLVASDGRVTHGADLGGIALLASQLNATISALKLTPAERDIRVSIDGPSKVIEGAEAAFTVTVSGVGEPAAANMKLLLDGTTVLDQELSGSTTLRRALPRGIHKLEAVIDTQDHFPQNNRFLKTVKAVQKPTVLFLTESESSPLATLLKPASELTVAKTLPSGNLSGYTAIVINGLPGAKLDPDLSRLIAYVTSGGGLLVMGGNRAFDRGGYHAAAFETLLPVFVGTPGKQEGDTNIALIIDISASTADAVDGQKAVDIEKALALNVLGQLRQDARLAVVAFNSRAFVVAEPKRIYEHTDIEDTIARLKDGGGTMVPAGIAKALQLLAPYPGSKNLVLISDGFTGADITAHDLVKEAAQDGVHTYTIGVGKKTNTLFMQQLAANGGGTYFEASNANRIRLLLGDLELEKGKEQPEVVFVDRSHFITATAEPKAKLYGWNSVVPRSTARLLAVTSAGDPLIAAWRFGLGRVAAIATDDGSVWAGQLVSGENGKVLVRAMNWAVGDPERHSPTAVEASDTRLGEATEVRVRSPEPPNGGRVEFVRAGEGVYSATVTPDATGFVQVGDAVVAVNHAREYDTGPLAPELQALVLSTNGRIFEADDTEDIIAFTRQNLQYTTPVRDALQGPLALAAIAIFLIEILLRRLLRNTAT